MRKREFIYDIDAQKGHAPYLKLLKKYSHDFETVYGNKKLNDIEKSLLKIIRLDLDGLEKFVVNYYYDQNGNLTQVNVTWNTNPDGSYVIDNEIPGSDGPNSVYRRYFQDDGSGNYAKIDKPNNLILPATSTEFTDLERKILADDMIDSRTQSQGYEGGKKSGGEPNELYTQHTKKGIITKEGMGFTAVAPGSTEGTAAKKAFGYLTSKNDPAKVYEVNVVFRTKNGQDKYGKELENFIKAKCPNANVTTTVDPAKLYTYWGGAKNPTAAVVELNMVEPK